MAANGTADHAAETLASYLKQLLPSESRSQLRDTVLPKLLHTISLVARALRESQHIALAGTANAFGDDQLNVDVIAEDLIRAALAECPAVVAASSEEDPVERHQHLGREQISEEQYTVAFDPLDGSSIIAPNWTVGTIIGIWDGATALNQDPREKQIGAILGVLGPRATAIIALRVPGSEPACFEVGFRDDQASTEITITRPAVRLAPPPFKTRYFAPANLRAAAEDERYMALVARFVKDKYTLRYSGGLVPDVAHALSKGHGVYVSPVTGGSGAKLRRLYELCPVALVAECAGGRAVDPAGGRDVLAVPVRDCDERGGLVCGTGEDVEMVAAALGA
ncbi:uncharacterized protein E0L32_005031 [Thyridium curvatum]|uniref:Sedoheptulose-1,7-bisphosphatase n=1 Tax=Thyridium curvatum TaxID=1093900 RepID=A0A507AY68_9PEZI|nr:uncharacterized protein E0L32_005031 [Thyridium curvatum]TPX14922.1 hypothetical protein E0L32_005031 [Thyridium curvatum]